MSVTAVEDIVLLEDDGNLAGDGQVAERVIKFIKERVVTEFKSQMAPLHERWSLTWWMLSGNTIDQAGPMQVHIPALYKAVETAAPRIEGAILSRDPWFRLRPRREEEEDKAETIAAYMDWQLDQTSLRSTIQEAARDLLVTQVCAYKLRWEHRESMVRRKVRMETPDGKVKTSWQRKRIVNYSGPKWELVDPVDFLIDLRATDCQTAEWVGDRAYYTLEELEHFENQGFIKNVSKLKENKSLESSLGYGLEEVKRFRSPTERSTQYREDNAGRYGMQQKVEVVTICAKFDLRGDGVFEECILTVANGNVCLQAMPNFYDFQMRPYTAARSARNGHNFFGVGILDNAVRINQHLDRLYAITTRYAEGVACPNIYAEQDSDLPDSLFHSRPFRVFKGVGRVQVQSIPDGGLASLPTHLIGMERHIEETTGIFKVQMGAADSAETATQSTLSLQEGNRRLQGIIRSFAMMLRQGLSIMHKMNCQFTTEETAFRALGKRAKHLNGTYLKIGPDSFMEDVDFEIVGLESLDTYGLKATGLQQILATAAPFMVANPGRVDVVGILHELFSALVGPDEADKYIKVKPPRDDRLPQEAENAKLLRGIKIQVSEDDPHDRHLMDMQGIVAKVRGADGLPLPGVDPNVWQAVVLHETQHKVALQLQREEDAIREREQKRNGMMQEMPVPEAGGTPAKEGGGESPRAGGFSNALTQPGENSGPRNGQDFGRAGRGGKPVAQEANRIA